MTDRGESPRVDGWTEFLGGLVERHPGFWIRMGDLETRLLADRIGATAIDRPIWIAGLARSGSTILLELLARHPETASHRYRDFPLVFMPWAWSWFVDRASGGGAPEAERAHGDRIRVTRESPEAFEEPLWAAFFGERGRAVLDGDTGCPAFAEFFRAHIHKLLVLRGGRRYLAKGNYDVTRLGYLKALFPDARFVVPVRAPAAHVASLMRQHARFCDLQAKDSRARNYMRRAGHFEFGLDRRAIRIGDWREVERLWGAGEEAAGWALQWAGVYGLVAAMLDDAGLAPAIRVARYEDLCAEPAGTVSAILDHCGLDDGGLAEAAREIVSAPDYYRASFTDAERDEIARRTSGVAARFGYA